MATMMPQLITSIAFVVATATDPFLVVFSLQLPCESQTVSFVSLWQFAPGALQSIVGKLGKLPLFGLLMSFHCAATRAIKHSNVNKSSLFMFKLFISCFMQKKFNSFTLLYSRLNNSNCCEQMSNEIFLSKFSRRKKSARTNYLLKSVWQRCFLSLEKLFSVFFGMILGRLKQFPNH